MLRFWLTGRWGAQRGRLQLAAAQSLTPDYSLMGLGIILVFFKPSRIFHPQTYGRAPRSPGGPSLAPLSARGGFCFSGVSQVKLPE